MNDNDNLGVGDFWARLPPQSVKNMGDPHLTTETPIWACGVDVNNVARSIYDSPKKNIRYGGCITVEVTPAEQERFRHACHIWRTYHK
jgi:hypothetical protein